MTWQQSTKPASHRKRASGYEMKPFQIFVLNLVYFCDTLSHTHIHRQRGCKAGKWGSSSRGFFTPPPKVTGHENMFLCHSEKSVSKRVRSFKILQNIYKHNPQGSCRALIINCFSWCSAQIHVTEGHLECRRSTASVWFQLSGRRRRENCLNRRFKLALETCQGYHLK